jgi:peptidoglycan-N-acetylmuramic acid deacetylase
MNLFRFPSGSHNERLLAMIKEIGYKTLFWSFAYVDWETANQPSEATALQKLTDRLHPGGLYLLHAVSNTNTNILATFIDTAKGQGYAFPDYN